MPACTCTRTTVKAWSGCCATGRGPLCRSSVWRSFLTGVLPTASSASSRTAARCWCCSRPSCCAGWRRWFHRLGITSSASTVSSRPTPPGEAWSCRTRRQRRNQQRRRRCRLALRRRLGQRRTRRLRQARRGRVLDCPGRSFYSGCSATTCSPKAAAVVGEWSWRSSRNAEWSRQSWSTWACQQPVRQWPRPGPARRRNCWSGRAADPPTVMIPLSGAGEAPLHRRRPHLHGAGGRQQPDLGAG